MTTNVSITDDPLPTHFRMPRVVIVLDLGIRVEMTLETLSSRSFLVDSSRTVLSNNANTWEQEGSGTEKRLMTAIISSEMAKTSVCVDGMDSTAVFTHLVAAVAIPGLFFTAYHIFVRLVLLPFYSACLVPVDVPRSSKEIKLSPSYRCRLARFWANQECHAQPIWETIGPIDNGMSSSSLNSPSMVSSTPKRNSSSGDVSFDNLPIEKPRFSPIVREDDGYLTCLGELEDIQLEDSDGPFKAITKSQSSVKKSKQNNDGCPQDVLPLWICCGLAPFARWQRRKFVDRLTA
ncbi:hypothetical protein L596_028609 [Steinernema carpocapsae]|uniref:Uncharacterized protein n=1 Tax=Steinernema carpocapsae TaxID=34508 RepID=A0A4U5LYW4_STECR|nr:hypothetical protein L596_028609 [Steinernema carpocapsae]